MKLKKMTALMLSAAMITGMLAGCGGSSCHCELGLKIEKK